MKKTIIFIIFCLLLTGCSAPALFKETKLLMDTFVEISIYSSDRASALDALKEAFGEIERIEKTFSRFDRDSEVSRVNRLAGRQEVNVSPELFKIIEDSIHYAGISAGSFDITAARFKKGRYKNIILNKKQLSLHFSEPDITLDFGGIVKGYAVDRAKDSLSAKGIDNALINIGGNMYAIGSARGRTGWNIGIQDPRAKDKIAHRLTLTNRAVSTSGDYERGRHIIDPATGEPAEGLMGVTVVAESAEKADALSTAIFVMGLERARKFVQSLGRDVEVFIFDSEGTFLTLQYGNVKM